MIVCLVLQFILLICINILLAQDTNNCKNEMNKFFEHNEDVQILNIYKNLNFSINNSEFREGYYDLEYTNDEILNKKKLDVILIPHSHCDAGWLQTYESYSYQTDKILQNAQKYLPMYDKMKFIYAEMGFFEIYWSKLNNKDKDRVKKLIHSGRYEIVTGGWVQNDEANSFYYGILMQLIEGHEFLKNHLDYKPKNHWSIDPFGLSTTMAYIMKNSGLNNAVISRTHYMIKKIFSQEKLFEFNWRQLTGGKEKDDLFTHVLPYDGYLFYEHCGPNSTICCSFDFLRLHAYSCPKIKPTPITKENINEKSEIIGDQFRKRGLLMNNSATFIPLGYDFAWSFPSEWEDQYVNFQAIFDYINKNDKFNMNIRWGTLQDYFDTVHNNIKELNQQPKTLSGDFFTYSDKEQRYWSGYYVTRPFHKRFERLLEHYLRAADIIYSSVLIKNGPVNNLNYNLIVKSRRTLAIFQHHDGITGTSKSNVMDDYRDKLFNAVKNCYEVIEKSISYSINYNNSVEIINKIKSSKSYEENNIIIENKTIIIMNPLGQEKNKIVCLKVPSTDYYILNDDWRIPQQEYHPVIENLNNTKEIDLDVSGFNLCFEVLLPPIGLVSYKIEKGIMYKPPIAEINVLKAKVKSGVFKISNENKNNKISNSFIDIIFNPKTGFIDSINGTKIDLHFGKYGMSSKGTPSGAYIFNPDGPSKRINEDDNIFIVSKGILKSTVFVKGSNEINLYHTYEINKFDKSISIQNSIDISSLKDFELVMKFNTSINNRDIFYTDLNGFQIIKRRYLPEMPIQGNFYPFPSMMYIEDKNKRLSIVTGQPLGVSSLNNGEIEILIDRRSTHDDECGMGEGIQDTLKAWSKFSIVLEDFIDNQININALTGFVSRLTHNSLHSLLYPPIIMTTSGMINLNNVTNFSMFKKELPCDIHLVMARSMLKKEDYDKKDKNKEVIREPTNEVAFIFNRFIDDCRIYDKNNNNKICKDNQTGYLNFTHYFNINYKSINDASLTLLNISNQTISDMIIGKQEIKSIKITI
ncbi:Alpha-mannosidase 2x [Strongyloides ratti]|uniref:Alpha-mannosidase n=1 Tax=Strongyloides ratti TaxID=34506 RepID=A0A090L2M4_STRRB|nr:Alpha-mannosidase 2x [Strongyloides ratti]CEF62357.1 Alpha-mannosidase 2x [Strongyloides ratti]